MQKTQIKLYVAGGKTYASYTNWLVTLPLMFKITENFEESNVVLFAGGEDVSPELYGEDKMVSTFSNKTRDIKEVTIAKEAIRLGKKMIGICRGAQLLCVMAGGKLVQDMYHSYNHPIEVINFNTMMFRGETIIVNSMHHQMQYPYNLKDYEYELLAYSGECKSRSSFKNPEGSVVDTEKILFVGEPEIVYYPLIKGLAIQCHPEVMPYGSECVEFCKECVDNILLND